MAEGEKEPEAQFDRLAFVPPKEPPPRSSVSPLVPLLLLVAVCLAAFAFYISTKRGPGGDALSSADMAEVVKKLEEMEERLQRLEHRRSAASREAATTAANQPTDDAKATPGAPPQIVYRAAPANKTPAITALPSPSPQTNAAGGQQQELSAVQGDVSASGEHWKATAERLGSVVGELGSQRREITQNRQGLGELMNRFQRTDLAFTLQKKSGRQRIGPVSLLLEKSDPKNQRYTLRVLADDKTILLENRALNEAVEFYVNGVNQPLELVVSNIRKDQVAGKLALPKAENPR